MYENREFLIYTLTEYTIEGDYICVPCRLHEIHIRTVCRALWNARW